jgi:large subunit ribosomal protein L24e
MAPPRRHATATPPPHPVTLPPPPPSHPHCSIYPGHGRRFVTKSGQLVILAGSKERAMYHQRKKPAKLAWTQGWRRMHKKLNLEAQAKRKVRRVVKVQRAPVGTTAEKLEKMRKVAPAAGAAKPAAAAGPVKQASVADAKAKAKKAAADKKAQRAAAPKAAPAAKSHAGKGR